MITNLSVKYPSYPIKHNQKFLIICFNIFDNRNNILRSSISVALYSFFECYFNYIINHHKSPTSKESKSISFLEENKLTTKYSIEETTRFLFDNLDEQVLQLEERTLSEKKEKYFIDKERLIMKIFINMFTIFKDYTKNLNSLDVLCEKNLFSYIRLKNKNLLNLSEIHDSKILIERSS